MISISGVSCAKIIEDGWAEGMDVAELKIGCCDLRRLQEPTEAYKARDVAIDSQPKSGTTIRARVPLSSGHDSMRATG